MCFATHVGDLHMWLLGGRQGAGGIGQCLIMVARVLPSAQVPARHQSRGLAAWGDLAFHESDFGGLVAVQGNLLQVVGHDA